MIDPRQGGFTNRLRSMQSKPKFRKPLELLSVDDVEALPDLEWLVPGIIPRPSLSFLYGEPGCGKTFVALSLALTMAAGGEWLGRQTVKTSVLYIAAEGVYGLKTRIAAHRKLYSIAANAVRLLPSAINVMEADDVKRLLSALDKEEFRPGLVIVDTLARVTVGADENNAKDMGRAIEGLDRIKSHYDAAVIVLHHTRKGGGVVERGSSVLRGAADVMIACEPVEGYDGLGLKLTCEKMKDAEPFPTAGIGFAPVTSADARSSLAYNGPFNPDAVTSSAAQVTEAQILTLLRDNSGKNGVRHRDLRDVFVKAGHGSKSKFNRAWSTLKESDRVTEWQDGFQTYYAPAGVDGVTPVSDDK